MRELAQNEMNSVSGGGSMAGTGIAACAVADYFGNQDGNCFDEAAYGAGAAAGAFGVAAAFGAAAPVAAPIAAILGFGAAVSAAVSHFSN